MKDVRSFLLRNRILALVDLGEDVFAGVVAPSCIFVVEKGEATSAQQTSIADIVRFSNAEKAVLLEKQRHQQTLVHQRVFQHNPDLEFTAVTRTSEVPAVRLGEFDHFQCKDAGINYQRVRVGMQEKGKSDLSSRLLYDGVQRHPRDKMYWKGSDIDRYWIAETTERYCRPNYHDFIRRNEVVRLNSQVYEHTPKILLRQTADHIRATIDYRGVWFGRSIIAVVPRGTSDYRIEYLLGLLNSRYFKWLYQGIVHETGRVFAQVKLSKAKQLPIRTIDFDDPTDKAYHEQMVALVQRMLDLHQQQPQTPQAKTILKRQIEATDREIDSLVYRLYDLTEDEIRIVEGG